MAERSLFYEMDLNRLISSVAKGEENALKELYEKYRIPFYFIALSIIQNDDAALSVAAEAFRRIRESAYRFDDQLNGEYWLLDVIYTMSYNKKSNRSAVKENISRLALPALLQQEPEVFAKIFTDLGDNEIAALGEKKKSAVSELLKEKKDLLEAIARTAADACPAYWETVLTDAPTGAETVAHNVRIRTETQIRKQKRKDTYKWIAIIALLALFVAGAAIGIIKLFSNNYGSDVEQNELGEPILLQFNNNIAMTELNGSLYFRGANNAFYKRDMQTGAGEKISDDYPKELLNDGSYVYYRNNNDGYLYRIDPDGGSRTRLCDVPGSAMALHEGFLYFSTTGGIYRIPSSGGTIDTAELVIDTSHDANLYCVDLALDAEGNVFFASGIGKGIHHVTEYNGEPSLYGIFAEEAYTIQIDGDKLYFDYKENSGKIILYSFDLGAYLEGGKETRVQPVAVSNAEGKNIALSTGAFYAKGGRIYYAGVSDGKSALFVLDQEGKETQVLPSDSLNAGKNLYITDIYITEEWAYCFSSDGKSNGKRIFFAGNLHKNETVTIYES